MRGGTNWATASPTLHKHKPVTIFVKTGARNNLSSYHSIKVDDAEEEEDELKSRPRVEVTKVREGTTVDPMGGWAVGRRHDDNDDDSGG